MSDQELSRLKNAFIKQYKVEASAEEATVAVDNSVNNSPELEYEFSESKLRTFAPSLIISVLVIAVAIIVFSRKSTNTNEPPTSNELAKTVVASESLVTKAVDFESISFLKAQFFDGIESYDLSLPLTLQESSNRNVIVDLDKTVSFSKNKVIVDLGPFEGSIEVFLKDSSLQSNKFNPIIIKGSKENQIFEISIDKLPDNILEDVNLYRIKELRLNLNKAKSVSFKSISLQ